MQEGQRGLIGGAGDENGLKGQAGDLLRSNQKGETLQGESFCTCCL